MNTPCYKDPMFYRVMEMMMQLLALTLAGTPRLHSQPLQPGTMKTTRQSGLACDSHVMVT